MDEAAKNRQFTLFLSLVDLFSGIAMQNLGKLVNPVTGKTERNLEAAAAAIDMLRMLEDRTRGNLAPPESQLLQETIQFLQLNYVTESGKPEPPPAPPPQENRKTQDPSA